MARRIRNILFHLLDRARRKESGLTKDPGTIPKAIAETLKLPLTNCSVEVTNLTNKIKPFISVTGTGRKWTHRLRWAMLEKQAVREMSDRLSQNKLTLLTGISGYTV